VLESLPQVPETSESTEPIPPQLASEIGPKIGFSGDETVLAALPRRTTSAEISRSARIAAASAGNQRNDEAEPAEFRVRIDTEIGPEISLVT
jgi:hypothetical protein